MKLRVEARLAKAVEQGLVDVPRVLCLGMTAHGSVEFFGGHIPITADRPEDLTDQRQFTASVLRPSRPCRPTMSTPAAVRSAAMTSRATSATS